MSKYQSDSRITNRRVLGLTERTSTPRVEMPHANLKGNCRIYQQQHKREKSPTPPTPPSRKSWKPKGLWPTLGFASPHPRRTGGKPRASDTNPANRTRIAAGRPCPPC